MPTEPDPIDPPSVLDVVEPYVPGMREQVHGKGIKLFVEHEFAPLRACLTGHPVEMWMPDPDLPEVRNGIGDLPDDSELIQTYRKAKGKHLREADPELYEHFCIGSDALAEILAGEGVDVVRTDFVPPEIVDMNTGWVDSKQLSMFPAGAGEVFGNVLVNTLEVSMGWGLELPFRDALIDIFEHDPDAIWLSFPQGVPSRAALKPRPFLGAGDIRVMPGKVVLVGFGVREASHVGDPTTPRTAGDELGAEVLRRMLRPFGWTVENLYFDSSVSYHWDCILGVYAEGVIGLPREAMFTELPSTFRDWDVIDLRLDEIAKGAANTVPLGGGKVLVPPNCPALTSELDERGITPIEVPSYDRIFANYGSGIHCSIVSLWRED